MLRWLRVLNYFNYHLLKTGFGLFGMKLKEEVGNEKEAHERDISLDEDHLEIEG